MSKLRLAARVAVRTPDNAIFLFRYDDAQFGRHWAMPGGGLEGDESYRVGAYRELVEETGWTDLVLGSLLWTWQVNFTRLGEQVSQYEQVFLAEGPERDPKGDLTKSHADDEILEWRWWTPSEVEATSDPLWPPPLATLLSRLRERAAPGPAVHLGVLA